MFVLIFFDFCGFIYVAYTTLNKLLAVFIYMIFAVLLKNESHLDGLV